jgi:ABC-type sugar transport system permease subunit
MASKAMTRRLRSLQPYVFITPFLLSFAGLFLGPAAYAFYLSFTRYRGFGVARWVGLENYRVILGYDVFWTMLGNTLFYWVAHALPMLTLAFVLAVGVQSRTIRWVRTFKTAVFLPQMLASVATALLFQNIFGTHYGLADRMLGFDTPWLTDPMLSRWTVVAVLIWRSTGYWFVVFLAGLTTISPEIDEAASLDGAGGMQRLLRITLPLMRPTLLFAVLVDAIVTLRLFAEPNVLLGKAGTLAPVTAAPLLNLVVEQMHGGQFGAAAATGWLLFVLIAVLTFGMFRLMGMRDEAA